MSSRMPEPRIVAYAASTGRALIECGEHVVWMHDAEALDMMGAWRDIADELQRRYSLPPEVVFDPEPIFGGRRRPPTPPDPTLPTRVC